MADASKPVPVRERLHELYGRLAKLPKVNTAEEALSQLRDTLDQVEDELSGIVKRVPPPPISTPDGRMYGPREDHIVRSPDGGILALTRGHRIEIGADGSMRIVRKSTGQVEFMK